MAPAKRPKHGEVPDRMLLYYPDGSEKAPASNPQGRRRAGAGAAKLLIVYPDGMPTVVHQYDLCMPVVLETSPVYLQRFNYGANAETNIVAEWCAFTCVLEDALWDLTQHDGTIEVEIRQDCHEILDCILSNGKDLLNGRLIAHAKRLWRRIIGSKRVISVGLYHVYSHGKGILSDRWNDHADAVAKKAADGFISLVGPFEIIKAAYSNFLDANAAPLEEKPIAVEEGTVCLYVDGVADPKAQADGWAWRWSDGTVDQHACGQTIQLLTKKETQPSIQTRTLRADLTAMIMALRRLVHIGSKKTVMLVYDRKSLADQFAPGRLKRLQASNVLEKEIKEAHAMVSQLAIAGSLVVFRKNNKSDSMSYVSEMAELATGSKRDETRGAAARGQPLPELALCVPIETDFPVLGPQWPLAKEKCFMPGCKKTFKVGGPGEVTQHVNAAHLRQKLPEWAMKLMPHSCDRGCGVLFAQNVSARKQAHHRDVVCPKTPANFDPIGAEDGDLNSANDAAEMQRRELNRVAVRYSPFAAVDLASIMLWEGQTVDVIHRDMSKCYRRQSERIARDALQSEESTTRRLIGIADIMYTALVWRRTGEGQGSARSILKRRIKLWDEGAFVTLLLELDEYNSGTLEKIEKPRPLFQPLSVRQKQALELIESCEYSKAMQCLNEDKM